MMRTPYMFPPVMLCVAALWVAADPVCAQSTTFDVSGQVRMRSLLEYDLVVPGGESATLLRTRLIVNAVSSQRLGAVVQIQDARVFGEETSTLADGSADRLDFHQAYLWIQGSALGTPFRLQAGRQEIMLSNQRLIGSVDWSNTGRSFDAVRLRLEPEGARWSLSTMAATVAERGRTSVGYDPRAAAGPGDHVLLGLSLDAGSFHADVLHDANAAHRGAMDIDRTTLASRWRGALGDQAALDLEGAFQFGSLTRGGVAQDVRAWFAGGRLIWTEPVKPLASALVGLDWLSGDDAASTGRYSAFHTLYATNHKFYGLMDFFLDPAARTGDRGLIDGLVTLQAHAATIPITATVHSFWLAATEGTAANDIGWELDVTTSIALEDSGDLSLGYAVFRAGDGGTQADLGPAGAYRQWAFAQLTITFR